MSSKKVTQKPAKGAGYPRAGRPFRDVAALIKADVGLEVAWIDVGGWDTHRAQGGASGGSLARSLASLARSLEAFRVDLGERFEHVVVLVMSEFGRTIRENGTGGTTSPSNSSAVPGGNPSYPQPATRSANP